MFIYFVMVASWLLNYITLHMISPLYQPLAHGNNPQIHFSVKNINNIQREILIRSHNS